MKILTVTPNPAVDQTVTVDRLLPGRVHRAGAARTNAGGKGVNVSSCLADWGLKSAACGFLGEENTVSFTRLFSAKNIEDRFVRIPGMTRTNIKIVDDEQTTDINLPGAPVSEAAVAELLDTVADLADSGIAVLAGSLPPGCPVGLYRRILLQLRDTDVKVIVDADGAALAEAVAPDAMPYCLKPNLAELSRLAGREIADPDDVAKEGERLRRLGAELVVVSMGGRGALFVGAEGVVQAHGSIENVASTVGAGDAMVAGMTAAMAEGAGLERTARLATAFSLGKLGRDGPNLPRREAIEELAAGVRVEWRGRG